MVILDWSTLKHAYGSAADVPALLDQIALDPNANVWDDLWSRLCHQGTVYSASFAALPELLKMAEQYNPTDRIQVLALASAIVGSNDVYGGRRDDLVRPVEWVLPRFEQSCRESLAEIGLSTQDFIYYLQAARLFEGDHFWGQALENLASGEFPGVCSNCESELYIVIGNYGCFSTAEDWVAGSSELGSVQVRPGVRCMPIEPNEGGLPEVGRWLHSRAYDAGQIDVGRWIRHIFGSSKCPACLQQFQVIDALQIP